ncbi:MAG: DNA methyltransferase [Pseudanabaena sp.]|nr:MAG: DNA methyltransferase [Pseudanabaena sp.]
MSEGLPKFEAIAMGTEAQRVEALREFLGYPLQELDRTGSGFRYVRSGQDIAQARNTCPIAVGFYEELDRLSDVEIRSFLTAPAQQQRIYGHYLEQDLENMPVMYLLLPVAARSGRMAMVLPMEGGLRQRQIETFAWNSDDLRSRLVRLNQENLVLTNRFKFADATRDFFSIPSVEWAFYKTAQTAKELAQLLAEVTRRIEQVLPVVFKAEGDDGYLNRLLLSFQRELLPSLKLAAESEKDYSFADIYAQTIAYGLFTARVFSHVRDPLFDFNRRDAWQQLPETNPFLRQLFKDVSEQKPNELGAELVGCIAEVFGILRAAKMDAILSDFREKMNREDIVIRFYEDFLAAYKPKMRERRGVYYTPEPVVSYMVRSVDILIKEKFNKPLGLADPEVMILDPACGTGTFLLWIFKEIYKRFQEKPDLLTANLEDKSWSGYVSKNLLPRVFGFELLMAPYAICHLKLGLFLEETGYKFDSSQRLGVYQTDSLIDALPNKPIIPFEEFIAAESDQSVKIKHQLQVMVVIGNPPYSYESGNNGAWINELVREYYQIGGKSLDEKNPRGLQDDYVKFMRLAEWRIGKTGYGISALVTNHGYLDNPTFRGMRHSLINTFDEIQILDLHGNSKRQEKNPSGDKDENVFDIQQGVSISIAIKTLDKSAKKTSIKKMDLWGDREYKYEWLSKNDCSKLIWNNIKPTPEFYLFIPQNTYLLPEYENGFKITDIFSVNNVSIVTARDSLTIKWSKEEIWNVVNDFASLPIEDARTKYQLVKDTRDWLVDRAQKDLQESGISESKLAPILYRPFDVRFTYYTGTWKGFHSLPRWDVMQHILMHNNFGMIVNRQVRLDLITHFWVSNSLVERHILETANASAYFLPLYVYDDDIRGSLFDFNNLENAPVHRRPNISGEFLTEITNKLGYTPTPEAIFYYIYAIFHSPTYRTRYAEFLKIDFPRVPLTSDDQLFRKLGEYGEELVALHLMKSSKLDQNLTQIIDKGGEFVVDAGHPKYSDGEVIINKKGDRFTGVPKSVWEFYVGGYQVCHKWLKDRKGRQLSPEDLNHYQKIIVALSETMQIMKAIDAAIPSFPIE